MASINPYNRLYHYTSFKTTVKYILPDFKLRLNPITKTNDPRENKSFMFGEYSRQNTCYEQRKKNNKKISDILRNDCKVLCFCEDNPNYCGYEMSRMWAYYGGKHKGICLELDKSEFIKENQSIIKPDQFKKINYIQVNKFKYRFINYKELESLEKETYLKQVFRPDNIDYLYFTKNEEWKSEEEIRLIHFSNNNADEFCSIKNSLKNIYLGVKFNKKNLQELIDLCPFADIYELEFKELRMITTLLNEGSKFFLSNE